MIKLIKFIHTVIWVIMAAASFYILYAALTNTFNLLLYFSVFLLVMETLVLLLNKWTCPLTPLAKKHTSDRRENFDIYLPNWLAKYNKIIFGFIFILGIIMVIFNWIRL